MTMIRCVRLWSGPDGNSHFEEGAIDLESGPRGDTLSGKFPIASVSFQETNADPKLGWHRDPARQLVITLSGALEFTTGDGRFSLWRGRHIVHRRHGRRPRLEAARRATMEALVRHP
jgi:hypothetical protein